MGRKLTLPMFVATLVATWYGGIFGVAQIAFSNGIYNFVSQGIFWYLTYIIFAFFILKKIQNFSAVTLPDLIGQMFGPRSEKLSAIFNILNLIPIAYTISLGLFIEMVFGINHQIGMVIGVLFVLSYSLFGGLRSVVYSDIFQFFIMCTSVLLVALLSVTSFGFEPLKSLPSHYFSPLGTHTLLETLSWGLIALSTLVDPNFYQRCFAAINFKVAKRGIIISTCIWIFFDLSLTLGALYARAIMPEAEPQYGYFQYALSVLPAGLRGFFLAGILATILSTLDSYIFLAGSTLSFDLVSKRFKGKILIHYTGVILVTIISLLMANIFDGSIKAVWKTLGSLSSSALLLPIIFGHIFPGKIKDMQFILAATMGSIGTIYWRLSGLKNSMQLDEIYIGMSLSALGLFISLFYNKVKQGKSHYE